MIFHGGSSASILKLFVLWPLPSFYLAMDRTALLFGLSSDAVDVVGCAVDLLRDDGLVELPERDLEFYEVFCGAAKLSEQMTRASRMNGIEFCFGFCYHRLG